MKKLFSLLVVILLSISLFGQRSIILGISVAPSITSFTSDTAGCNCEVSPTIAMVPSIDLYFPIDERLGIKSGLSYERIGVNVSAGEWEQKESVSYLVIPLKASFSTKGKVKVYCEGGGFIGIVVKQSVTIRDNGEFIEERELSPILSKASYGISGGLGTIIPISERIIIDLGLRGNIGLNDIIHLDEYDTFKRRTNSIGFQIGIKYRI